MLVEERADGFQDQQRWAPSILCVCWLLDDVHASWIFDVYCEFVSRGDLTTETFYGDWEEAGRNVLARIE